MTSTVQHQAPILGILARAVFGLAVVLGLGAVATPSAGAQVYSVLYSFTGVADGENPYGGVIQGANGNLYGTTAIGGLSGFGVVYRLDTTGEYAVVYTFTGTNDGGRPVSELVKDKTGNLYGTTSVGGAFGPYGTVFKVDRTGAETVLHSFNGADGSTPYAGLLRDAAGNFYGTTFFGGSGSGVVFKMDSLGGVTVLYSFGGLDGRLPVCGLVRDRSGNLYGTTNQGGAYGYGTVFKLNVSSRQETILHSFKGGADGQYPEAGLIMDGAGNLYGTANGGVVGGGGGVVFKLDTTGKGGVLYRFSGGSDGALPGSGYLVRDAQGNLYGTTTNGGDLACNPPSGCGTVFKIDSKGIETVLHTFHGTDGRNPEAGVIRDAAGNIYGTTVYGGDYDQGTVFKLAP